MEKIISEWRVVETDDGFRIEIKGDKEALRGWLKRRRPWGRMRFARHMPFGLWGHGLGRHRDWCWAGHDQPEEEDEGKA